MQYLTIWDAILTPIYLLILINIAKWMRDKRYPQGHPLRKFYLPGLYVKFGGAIFIALIYAFYYGGGDTYNFFAHSKGINSALNDSFTTWFKLMTRQSPVEHPEIYKYASQMPWYNDPSSYTVAVVAAVFGLFTGTTYLPTALFFAFLSYTGIWAMFRTFSDLYPRLHKELAIAFLFIPSTFVWGSAIFKDTICMFALGWLTYTTFRVFVNGDIRVKNLLLLVFSFYLIYLVKIYILVAFLPALSLWMLTTYSSRIKSIPLRIISQAAFIGIAISGFFFFTRIFADELNRYSLENIARTAATTRDWIYYVSEKQEGSAYNLGEFEPTFGGMLTKFPQAVVVTLFRPFPWEATKLIMMLPALEALLFIYFTYRSFRSSGLRKGLNYIFKDPNLLFCFVFAMIFAFAVGISSYNFGTLSRYKIPCLPFYGAFLMILLHHKKTGTTDISNQSKRLIKVSA